MERVGEPPARKLGRPTARERAERREQILDAALAVFLEHGFGNATIEELAAAARVTKRTVYSYFGDKAGVFAAMIHRLATSVSSATLDDDTLETLAAHIVYRLDSEELIGLHRLVIAESYRFPDLAVVLHDNGAARHMERLAERIAAEHGYAKASLGRALFTLLLGEHHRRRLHGLAGPMTGAEARAHALDALATLGLDERPVLPPLPGD